MGARATDLVDREVLVESSGSVKWNKPGEYLIVYTAEDSTGNRTSLKRKVEVVDTTGPVITLNGEASVTHEAGSVYKDAGANVADAADKLVEVKISGDVLVNTVGVYPIVYTAEDSSGNRTSLTRKVNVVDTTGPVIVLSGEATVTHEAGSVYND